ncbi:hypothetical protein GGE43_005191 [Agrobacterium tumefaciens]|uniref:Uncharacterized protein n=1 Tax=Agrobacterium radiobacter TaxID=362 RepID=A0ABR6JEN6_AGRRD|nr:hypothetical protein [Agrobacterium radiobacter]CUX52347.1 hypothetical protein AGR4B_pAt20006 [Agrobacterium tumefaciens str. CFBP 5621]MBB4338461.1 hypothetical protein [Agrobacterium radiobacter]MBB4493401.1 hypothetical protein [Agrobacterium radiobacter]MBB4498620.1 hypothetical protein [Agrobacterium radiobacter]
MRFTDKVSLLPLHAQAHLYLDGITVAKVIQAGLDKTFTIDRVLIVIPAISSPEPHAAPDMIIAAGEAHALDIDPRPFKELIVEIAMGAVKQALVILPRAFMVKGHTETASQALSTVEADTGAECIGKRIEIDIGIH